MAVIAARNVRSRSSFLSRSAAAFSYQTTTRSKVNPTFKANAASGYGDQPTIYPPQSIPWTKEAANSIKLIGNVGGNPDVKYFETGNVVANFSLAVNDQSRRQDGASEKPTDWYSVECWNDRARRAQEYIRVGDRIAIQGVVKMDHWLNKADNQPRSAVKIVMFDFATLQDTQQQAYNNNQDYQSGNAPSYQSRAQKPSPTKEETEALWKDLFQNTSAWTDTRMKKRDNPRHPDFKNLDNQGSLWITSKSTPAWVYDEIPKLDASGALRQPGVQAFLQNDKDMYRDNDRPPF